MALRTFVATLAVVVTMSICAGEGPDDQPPPSPDLKIPPATVLTAEEALKTFKLPPGLRIEIVAAEPEIETPVAIDFDADGRIWAVEMKGYMETIGAPNENDPLGRIVVLEDTNGDGRMDKRTVFQDELVMPRSVLLVNGGALVAEPPKLWFMKDTNGDLKADERICLSESYGIRGNPQNISNGLLLNIDNWIYSANHGRRYRLVNGKWEARPAAPRGQWGHTQDDFGRMFHNNNSDLLRGDPVNGSYLQRNPHFSGATGANLRIAADQAVWPARITTGVNRGYMKDILRADGSLASVTASCGPCVYRGDLLPPEFRGNIFICEPAGNLVKRMILKEADCALRAENAYDKTEFFTSTDERCRPVNLSTGPDGALYLIDLSRGILEHKISMTPYLKRQIVQRRLDKPTTLGRIYRIVPNGKPAPAMPRLAALTPAQLVTQLESANGRLRDMAQRLLIERGDKPVADALRNLALKHTAPTTRLQALWTLEGLQQLDAPTLLAALADPEAKIRAAAVRLSEPFLPQDAALLSKTAALASDSAADVQLQLMLSLSSVPHATAETCLETVLSTAAGNVFIRDAAVTGLAGREFAFLEKLLSNDAWTKQASGRDALLSNLALCVFNERNIARIGKLLEKINTDTIEWRQIALLNGMIESRPKWQNPPKLFMLPAEPAVLAALNANKSEKVQALAKRLAEFLSWPGKPGMVTITVPPLTATQQESFTRGKHQFQTICAACHQLNGLGEDGKAPPLVDSDWVSGSEQRLVRMLLHGLKGPLTVNGKVWTLEMPAMGEALDDQKIADVLTYIRREWEHQSAPVDVEVVKAIRAATQEREDAWNQNELLKIK